MIYLVECVRVSEIAHVGIVNHKINAAMDVVLKNFTLIDGTNREPIANALIAIFAGKIIYAGSALEFADFHDQVTTIDLHGKYVLPGLIDTHVHLAGY
jgi:predicted amidohydrolase YtcJ